MKPSGKSRKYCGTDGHLNTEVSFHRLLKGFHIFEKSQEQHLITLTQPNSTATVNKFSYSVWTVLLWRHHGFEAQTVIISKLLHISYHLNVFPQDVNPSGSAHFHPITDTLVLPPSFIDGLSAALHPFPDFHLLVFRSFLLMLPVC